MGSERSAFTVLGLEPGADGAAVDEAYRRLIKLHHPDRSGGDGARAAEINRAYFELRRKRGSDDARPPPPAGDVGEAIYARRVSRTRSSRRPRRRRRLWPFLAIGAAAVLLLEREKVADAVPRLVEDVRRPWTSSPDSFSGAGGAVADLGGELSEGAIARSIRLAAQLDEGNEEQRVEESRDCHREMRSSPTAEQLDRCAAFDYSMAMLQDRDAVSDGGPFGASAVTARQMAAARLLSNDFTEIEARLDRIRSRVELALAPPEPPPPPVQSGGAEPPA